MQLGCNNKFTVKYLVRTIRGDGYERRLPVVFYKTLPLLLSLTNDE